MSVIKGNKIVKIFCVFVVVVFALFFSIAGVLAVGGIVSHSATDVYVGDNSVQAQGVLELLYTKSVSLITASSCSSKPSTTVTASSISSGSDPATSGHSASHVSVTVLGVSTTVQSVVDQISEFARYLETCNPPAQDVPANFGGSSTNPCTGPDGSVIASGSSKTYYKDSYVPFGNSCLSQSITCTNDVLSPQSTYSQPTCYILSSCGNGIIDNGEVCDGNRKPYTDPSTGQIVYSDPAFCTSAYSDLYYQCNPYCTGYDKTCGISGPTGGGAMSCISWNSGVCTAYAPT